MKRFLTPSLSKIAAYLFFFFIMPTYYYVCTDEICNLRFSFFMITHLLYNRDFGMLTFPGLILLIVLSYLMACAFVRVVTPFFKMGRQKI